MITRLDHLVLLCPDLEAGISEYQTLLGIQPVWQSETEGQISAVFPVGNTALELVAPQGDGQTADRLRQMTAQGARLTSLVYASDDLCGDHHGLARRGLSPQDIRPGQSRDQKTGAHSQWQVFRLSDETMAGVKSFVIERSEGLPETSGQDLPGQVSRLDHLVITTPNPDRAVANYGARLGLRLALDRRAEEWKTRFLFFRLADLTLEIIHRLDHALPLSGPDQLWGLTWQTEALEAAHQRLSEARLDLSEIRTGRKPGSRVFTVRSGTLGVPTLFIEHNRT